MFLAIREIKKEKLRYGLILTVVVLISYLIFILSALALGLATANTAAVDSWQSGPAVMTKKRRMAMPDSHYDNKNRVDVD